MSKTSKTERVYITIEVDEPWRPANEHAWGTRGAQKASEVRRLLAASGLDGLGDVDYKVDRPLRCSFCADLWKDDPGCCQEAVDEWALEHLGVLPMTTEPQARLDAEKARADDNQAVIDHMLGKEWVFGGSPWVCEEHPNLVWPHGDCAGPGMPPIPLKARADAAEAQVKALTAERDELKAALLPATHCMNENDDPALCDICLKAARSALKEDRDAE